ncbi:MAG: hypothetical protein A3F70_06350 [Acidobacteria bacterium RIFCSPLOWO2_12_FULL_67_14]|nr:MAG: hypothetical protein A3H29_01925 [Acidobacteria bacterium RIFCSPLOWO2_02_FULL_67_21]OFW37007.1 MAG: hypothetical protein A3F70_06350 [Acidobacteria bacterium RIFCSPLOWO2_12_FULL_67_14]
MALPLILTLMSGVAFGQTHISRPPNNFAPAEDVDLGREAAAAIRRQMPILSDRRVAEHLARLGEQLVLAIPDSLREPAFEYSFSVFNFRDLTTAALPGGPIFVSRGMLSLAPGDDALAGLIAHELAHIVLRHSTAQLTASEQYQIGPIAGHSIAAVLRGGTSNILERASGFAALSYFLMTDREFERDADTLAVHLMARAGYSPRALATMLHAIRTEGAAIGGVLWLLRHPDPAEDEGTTRSDLIAEEAARVPIAASQPPETALASIHSWLADLGPAAAAPAARDPELPVGTLGYSVLVPSGESRSVTAGDVLQLNIPANWRRLPGGNAVTFAPDGAFLRVLEGPIAFTHGLQVAVARSITGQLTSDVQVLLANFAQGNRNVTWTPAYQRVRLAGREGVTTTLSSVSAVTGNFENVVVWATHLSDGSFLYIVGLSPQEEAGAYRQAFTRAVESLRIRN